MLIDYSLLIVNNRSQLPSKTIEVKLRLFRYLLFCMARRVCSNTLRTMRVMPR